MHILGLVGPINHGKSTAASYLVEGIPNHLILESSDVISEVAHNLNSFFDEHSVISSNVASINAWIAQLVNILAEDFGIHTDYSSIELSQTDLTSPAQEKLLIYIDRLKDNPNLKYQTIDSSNKEDHRPILQWIGGHLVARVDDEIWYNEMIKRAKAAEENGCELTIFSGIRYLKDAEIVRKHGGKIIRVSRPGLGEIDNSHATEAQRGNISPDLEIINNGSLEELKSVCLKLQKDLFENKLRFEYKAIENLV